MSFSFVIGPPGSGKSLYAVGRVVQELRSGSRAIVTNLPIWVTLPAGCDERKGVHFLGNRRVETIQRYMWRVHRWPELIGEDPVAIDQLTDEQLHALPGGIGDRLKLLTLDETGRFFYHRERDRKRGEWIVCPKMRDPKWEGKGDEVPTIPDFGASGTTGGVLYVIDEVHRDYPSRRWQKNGLELLYYVAEHRKLSDDVLFLTNSPGQVDKQCKEAVESWIVLRNRRRQKFGPVRVSDKLEFGVFPLQPVRTDRPIETGSLEVDAAGIAAIYDTAAGSSVHGTSGADSGVKLPGISPRWIWALVPAIGLALWFAPRVVSGAAGSFSNAIGLGAQGALAQGQKGGTNGPAGPPSLAERFLATDAARADSVLARPVVASAPQLPPLAPLKLVGIAPDLRTMRRGMVMLSDGRVLRLGVDRELERIGDKWAVVSGERVTF